MTQSDTLLQKEPVKEPAKRWFNWWRIHLGHAERFVLNGQPIKDGEAWMAPKMWPTEEIARLKAQEHIDAITEATIEHGGLWGSYFEYLGAYPEGERP